MENQSLTQKKSNNFYENILKKVLQNIGFIGATLMSIAYIAIVVVLIVGFKTHEWKECLIFALVNTIVGLIIMQFLKIQGISFAKIIPENKAILDEYYNTKTKDKKLRSIKYYWLWSVIKDLLIKGIMFVSSTVGIIYMCIEGSKDLTLLLFAVVNLVMFICFGLLALNQAYEFFNNRHIPYMIEKIKEIKKENTNGTRNDRNEKSQPRHAKSSRVQQSKKSTPRRTNRSHKLST